MRLGSKVLVFLMFVGALFGRGLLSGNCEQGGQLVTTLGLQSSTYVQRSFPSCTITVYVIGSGTPSTIYSDNAGSPKLNPFTADPDGGYKFFADDNNYEIHFSNAAILTPFIRYGTIGGGISASVSTTPTANFIPKAYNTALIDIGWLPRTGTGSKVATSTGALTIGNVVSLDSNGNYIASGTALANIILSTGTYANPSWITSLAGAKITGAVALASAFDHTPTQCSAGNYPLGINDVGNAQNCTAITSGGGENSLKLSISGNNLSITGFNTPCSAGTPCFMDIGNGTRVTFTNASTAAPSTGGNDTWYSWVTNTGVRSVGYNTVAPTCTNCTAVAGITSQPTGLGIYVLGQVTVALGVVTVVPKGQAVQQGAPNTVAGTNLVGTPSPTNYVISLPTASSSVLGAAKCDGTTITCASGNFVAIGGGGTTCAVTAPYWPFGQQDYGGKIESFFGGLTRFQMFIPPCTMTVSKITVYVDTASGTCGGTCGMILGLYNSAGTSLLGSSNVITSGGTPNLNASAAVSATFASPVTLTGGTVYGIYLGTDSTVLKLDGAATDFPTGAESIWNLNAGRSGFPANSLTGSGAGLALPATTGAISGVAGARGVPLLCMFE